MRALAIFLVATLVVAGCSDDSGPEAVDARPSATTDGEAPEETTSDDTASTTSPSTSPSTSTDTIGSDTAPSTISPDTVSPASTIEWEPCEPSAAIPEIPGIAPLECASIEVPRDHDEPGGPTIPIALARQEALDPSARIGSIVFNPGGPGGSGIEYLASARLVIPADVAEVFDLVSFDPRGVGASASVHCDLTRDDGVVLIADDDREAWNRALQTARDELATCTSDPAGVEAFVGTNNAARDLDLIREAVGDEALTYVGFSYGTRLGATYAALFPDRVRALVLDGGVLPSVDSATIGRQQAAGFDLALGTFADTCDADPDCAVGAHGQTLDVLDELEADIEAQGSFPTDDPTRALTPGELQLGVIAALYSQSSWNYLALAIDEAASTGDGTLFQILADTYLGREPDGTYTNQVEAGAFISCADDPARPGEDDGWAQADAIADTSEHFGDGLRASFGCLDFPESIDPLIIGDADGAPPILVIGTTGDPATPFDWSHQLADSLASGVLYSVDGEGHTAYTSIDCVTPVVNAYLIDLEVPEAGDGCTDDSDVDPFPPAGESDAELVVGFFTCLAENGAEVDVSIADVLRDPTGESLLGDLDLTDPALLGALIECESFLTG